MCAPNDRFPPLHRSNSVFSLIPYSPSVEDGTAGSLDINNLEMDTMDFIDMLEDPDEVPAYTGAYDFSGF